MTCRPATTAASAAFSAGTSTPILPSARARRAIGRTPLHGRTAPVSASSPTMTKLSSWSVSICSLAASMPSAMGRSKLGPSFFTSAGARLMVVRPIGNLKPELVSAVVTRSRDSFTAASGRPTMTISVSPQPALTSTSTGYASMPLSAAEQTLANIRKLWSKPAQTSIKFLRCGTTAVKVGQARCLSYAANPPAAAKPKVFDWSWHGRIMPPKSG